MRGEFSISIRMKVWLVWMNDAVLDVYGSRAAAETRAYVERTKHGGGWSKVSDDKAGVRWTQDRCNDGRMIPITRLEIEGREVRDGE